MIPPNQEERKRVYAAILSEYDIDWEGTSTCAEEDAGLWMRGENHFHRFCVVTMGNADGVIFYCVAHDDEFDEACERACESMHDDIYPETPVAIIDLDTLKRWAPMVKWNRDGEVTMTPKPEPDDEL